MFIHSIKSNHTFISDRIMISQLFGAFVVCLAYLNMGSVVGYATNALAQWKNETNVQVKS